jgi:hypothetical protein
MFDTISGLPLHPLLVHGVVIGLPVMAIVTFVVAWREPLRRWATWVAAVDVLVLVLTQAAKQAGEKLQAREAQFKGSLPAVDHAAAGRLLPYFALAIAIGAGVAVLARTRTRLVPVALVLTLVAGLAGIGWTVKVGDSGARSLWGPTVQNSQAP